MKRVASLYLPDWPIDRLRRIARTIAPPPEAPLDIASAALDALYDVALAERSEQCSVPRGGGWRPGARWARVEVAAQTAAQIAGLPAHQRPPMRELGRRSEAVDHPFKPMPSDEGRSVVRIDRGRGLNPDLQGGWGASVPRSLSKATAGSPAAMARPAQALSLLVTSIQQGNKLVIAAASSEARAVGIVPGMAVTQARAQVPGLDIRPADPAGDRADLKRLAIRAARRWCPLVALSGEDGLGDNGLFLDITGTAHLFGGEAAMARRIVRLLARLGVTARIAVADTTGAAWALARYAPQICPSGTHSAAIAPLPVAALRLEDRAIELLKRLGVDTIGQLTALPRAPLARRFGGRLVARLDQASGRIPEPLDPVVPPVHIAVVQRFVEPIATAEAIAHWLGEMMPRLVTALAHVGQGARLIELVADRIDGVPQRLRIGLARPTRDATHLLRLIARRIEEIEPGFGIDALALHVRRSEPLGPAPFAERLDGETELDLAPLVDTLTTRIGPTRLWRATAVESDVPERSVDRAAPLDPPGKPSPRLKPDDLRQLDRRSADHPWHPRWPRPVRLLGRPEPIDHVIAELPDHAPRRFTWRGRVYRIIHADGPERITGEWWKRTSEQHAVRDYFCVEDDVGQRFWLFRRGDAERAITGDLAWFMHGGFG